jgi:hypothetical protein
MPDIKRGDLVVMTDWGIRSGTPGVVLDFESYDIRPEGFTIFDILIGGEVIEGVDSSFLKVVQLAQ